MQIGAELDRSLLAVGLGKFRPLTSLVNFCDCVGRSFLIHKFVRADIDV
jgi:hypothetical protein